MNPHYRPGYGPPQYGQPPGNPYYQQQAPGQVPYQPPGGYPGAAPGGYPGQGMPMASGYPGFAAPGVGSAPPGIEPDVWQWFLSVDQDRSGKITCRELQQALVNGNMSAFNEETCRLMIGMFDRDRNGTIDVNEFQSLWKYIQQWRSTFDGFDRDRSGNINGQELHQALTSFGYRLSDQFCQLCVRVFDRKSTQTMKFDDFIQCCVMVHILTNSFKQKDTTMDGQIQIGYEEFLQMVIENTVH